MVKHKECPFCANNGDSVFICIEQKKDGAIEFYVECSGCGARSGRADSENAAWTLWDRREQG